MRRGKALVVDQAGATGPVNVLFRQILANPALRMELGEVATARDEYVGDRLGDHDPACPEQWADRRLVSLEDLARLGNGAVVFSGLQAEPAAEYEDALAKGRLVVTNASANRTRPDVPVANAFINAGHIDELFQRDQPGRIIAGGNCMSNIVSIAAFPLHEKIGIRGIHIETMQGWSGAGLSEVPDEIPMDGDDIADQIVPITGDEWEKVRTEPKMFLGASMGEPADINVTAKVNRGPWVRGHHARIEAKLARETSKREVEHVWRHFKAPDALEAVKSEIKTLSQGEGENWPGRYQHINPVKQEYGDLVRYDTIPIQLARIHPMRANAHLQEIDQGNPQWITFEVSGHNLILGADGVNLLNVIYARAKGYLSEQG